MADTGRSAMGPFIGKPLLSYPHSRLHCNIEISRIRTRKVRARLKGLALLLRADKRFALHAALVHVHEIKENRTENTAECPAIIESNSTRSKSKSTHSPKRNAKGMLSLLLAAVMIADETTSMKGGELGGLYVAM